MTLKQYMIHKLESTVRDHTYVDSKAKYGTKPRPNLRSHLTI